MVASLCNVREEGLIERGALTQALCRQMGCTEKGVAGEFNLFQPPPFFTGPLGRKITEREGEDGKRTVSSGTWTIEYFLFLVFHNCLRGSLWSCGK